MTGPPNCTSASYCVIETSIVDCLLRFGQSVESVGDQVRQFHEQLDRKIASLGSEIKQWKAVEATRKAEMDDWMRRMAKSMEHAELEHKDLVWWLLLNNHAGFVMNVYYQRWSQSLISRESKVGLSHL